MAKTKSTVKKTDDKHSKSKVKKTTTRKKAAKKTIGNCFVLMPFKEPFNTYYKSIIKPAVSNANLNIFRGDSLFRPSPIMADIWDLIKDAKLLVAELTEKNANVFYELGLAHAIGKPVILLSETIDDVPFDLQSLRVIIYDKDDPSWGNKLKNNLTKSINETIESPVESVPQMFRKVVKSQAPIDTGLNSRIAAIERRLSILDSSGRYSQQLLFHEDPLESSPKSMKEIELMFYNIHNDASVEEAIIYSLNNGVPRSLIIKLLRRTTPKSTVQHFIKKFKLS